MQQAINRYTVFIQGATDDDIQTWLEPVFGKFSPLADVVINDCLFHQYEAGQDTIIKAGLSDQDTGMLAVKIETRGRPWSDVIACADSAYAVLGLAVICDGGLPEPSFMWYVHDAFGQGLIDPADQEKRH